MTTVFDRIIRGEIPSTKVYEDDLCIAIRDIHPVAPTHVLIIPKRGIAKLADARPEDAALLGHLLVTAGTVARQLGCGDAFRLVVNNGSEAGQTVFHLHLHLIAGRPLSWPPG